VNTQFSNISLRIRDALFRSLLCYFIRGFLSHFVSLFLDLSSAERLKNVADETRFGVGIY